MPGDLGGPVVLTPPGPATPPVEGARREVEGQRNPGSSSGNHEPQMACEMLTVLQILIPRFFDRPAGQHPRGYGIGVLVVSQLGRL